MTAQHATEITPSTTAPPSGHWHCMAPGEVAARLEVDPATGLQPAEATHRLERYGPNKLAEQPPTSVWKLMLQQVQSFLILLLFGASLLAAAIGHFRDAVVILVVTAINSVLGFYQEYRAERSLAALKRMLALHPHVRRGGEVLAIAADELVPGEIVRLETGDRIAADGRLIEAYGLEIDESTLTGESFPVGKTVDALADEELPLADRRNMVYMNTVVTRGRGWFIVTSTGRQTQIGHLADRLAEEPEGATPLQRQLDGLGKRLSAVAGVIIAVIFALGIWRGTALADVVLNAIALAVAAIPEGLPAVVTVTLALGMQRMVRQRAIVKRLSAVETLGSTTVICSDKTGTLTMNQMTVRAGYYRGERFTATGEGYRPNGELTLDGGHDGPIDWEALLHPMALCNDSNVQEGRLIGDPTEGALLTLALKGGVARDAVEAQRPRIAEIPFDSERQYMATYHSDGQHVHVHVKGAPEQLLERCDTWMGPAGIVPLDDAVRERLQAENARLAAEGLRVLAVASTTLPYAEFDPAADLPGLLRGLTFVGLAGLMDPPRPEVREAIELCRQAGIQVKMITGDQRETARAIANALGLTGGVITGPELDQLEAEELADQIENLSVFARVTPEHKMKIVRSLKAHRHVVAMTGDGVNDAPALKIADIGVAMGLSGTEVAKEAASMVLTDDNFATIVRSVREGRVIYDNIVKFMRFQLSTNLGAIFTVLAALLLGLPEVFNPIQLLWINIIMDGPPAMSLGMDQAAPGIMQRWPRLPGERILSMNRLVRLVFFGGIMMAGTLGVMMWSLGGGTNGDMAPKAATMAFTTFVLFQFFNAFNARSERRSAFAANLFSNPMLWISVLGTVVLQVIAVNWGPAREIFHIVPLNGQDWAIVFSIAASVLVIEEVRKAMMWAARKVGVVPAERRAVPRPV
ncbi:MAG TPA: HAD-IC family P-type ATPase [bacterium]|nr:HAD-IC family P-type ATPase [bacterium]